MDVAVQIIASGLTLGAMYAVSTIGLALVYGSLNMLNMAHGALLALGGYVCFYAMTALGLHPVLGVAAAMIVCGAVGLFIYYAAAQPMLSSANFETQIFIATIGLGAIIENVILRLFGPQPQPQPLNLTGALVIGTRAHPAPEPADPRRRARADDRRRPGRCSARAWVAPSARPRRTARRRS